MASSPSFSDLTGQAWYLCLVLLGRLSGGSIVQTGLRSSAKLHTDPSGLYMQDVTHAFFRLWYLLKALDSACLWPDAGGPVSLSQPRPPTENVWDLYTYLNIFLFKVHFTLFLSKVHSAFISDTCWNNFITCSYCNFVSKDAGTAYSCLHVAVCPFVPPSLAYGPWLGNKILCVNTTRAGLFAWQLQESI